MKTLDGGFLTVVCDTTTHLIAIVIKEPRANWKVGEQINVITKDDTGVSNGTSHGVVRTPTFVVVKNESTLDLVTMGHAKKFFPVSAGDYV
jgi:adenosyl cobinamide kinase/adenosyl cobinamide phosphate guanylyltransferase